MDQNQFLAKEEIKKRIKAGQLDEAEALLADYENKFGLDVLYYLLNSIVSLERDDTETAEQNLFSAQQLAPDQFEVLYLLGSLYEKKEDYPYALEWYNKARDVAQPGQMEQLASQQHVNTMAQVHSGSTGERKKLKIFVRQGFDQFLSDLVEGLDPFYDVERVVITAISQIEPAMQDADICWFEWCDELVMHASQLEIARKKPIVCRMHRYEAFTDIPGKVQWERIDVLMLVTDHLITILRQTVPGIEDRVQISVVNNGVATDKILFTPRSHGYNIASVGYIHMRKNPMMLLQIMEKLVRFDSRYKLHVAGKFQDTLVGMYWEHAVKEMGLTKNIQFDGWQENITSWLSDKNFLVSTSIHESFGYSIAEAMSMGIKPVVHNFPFSTRIWPEQILFNTVDEAVGMITSNVYSSVAYRNFIESNYSLFDQVTQIRKVLSSLPKEKDHNMEMPMFEQGALRERVDQLVNPTPPVIPAETLKSGTETAA
ncbi:MAG: glycosyltransferase [Rhodothermales bacterium]